jgi:hypothetical protein
MLIETAYDNFHSIVQTSLNDYGATLTPVVEFKELYDNVLIEENDDALLRNGYAIEFQGDQNEATMLGESTQIRQSVSVILTTQNLGTLRDMVKRKAAEKRLMAMKDAIVEAVARDPNLNDTVASCLYDSSEPIELVFSEEEKNYLMKRLTFTIGYFVE